SRVRLGASAESAPEAAVFTTPAPDRPDRHGTLESYLEAKLRVFANQGNDDVAVFNGQTPELRGRDLGGCARRIRFCPADAGAADPDCELSMRDGVIFADEEPLIEAGDLKLLGGHSVENAMAAAAAALASGLPRDAVAEGLRSFEGVQHRLERVRELNGVMYVNDSKATNVASGLAGIQAFVGGVHLILGGRPKGEGFEPLAGPISDRCEACYLIGEASDRLAVELSAAREAGVEITECGTLERAVEAAAAGADPGQVI